MNETLPAIDPKTTALLVMDYQAAILGMLGDSESLLARAGEAIHIARDHGAHIGHVRVAFDDADYDAVPPHSRFAPLLKAVGSAFHSDSPGTAVHGDVAPQPGDIVVRKTRVGAFSTTDLDRQLKVRGIVTLLPSADREPDVHEFLIGKVFPMQAHVVRVADLDQLLSARGDA